ncbi:GAF domain-containing protein [uncultured Bacteroides sp.]|uniref:GAF domain-containing protein n=1 Tax=uncultured Bacteroides sp. TaxID=162156 RepID=UPI002AA779F9|nr:GAF domain-containing protein [uncultured Bacteroides sp.]
MAESLKKIEGTKEEVYKELLPQIKALIEDEEDLIANLSNTVAVLKETFGFFWVGFYFVKGDDLVLGPFQGPIACTRIRYGRGVCGTAWKELKTQIVADVDAFPGHIACSSLSRSEIVVPLIKNGTIWGVLDVDSAELNTFDETDKKHLEHLASILNNLFLSIVL